MERGRGLHTSPYRTYLDSVVNRPPVPRIEIRHKGSETAVVSSASSMGSAYGPGPTWKARGGPIAEATSRASPIIGLAPRWSGSCCAMCSSSRCSSVGECWTSSRNSPPESLDRFSCRDRSRNEIGLPTPNSPDDPGEFVGQRYAGAVVTGMFVEFHGPGTQSVRRLFGATGRDEGRPCAVDQQRAQWRAPTGMVRPNSRRIPRSMLRRAVRSACHAERSRCSAVRPCGSTDLIGTLWICLLR